MYTGSKSNKDWVVRKPSDHGDFCVCVCVCVCKLNHMDKHMHILFCFLFQLRNFEKNIEKKYIISVPETIQLILQNKCITILFYY